MRPTVIMLQAWGKKYLGLMNEFLIPCLLSQVGSPELKAMGPVIAHLIVPEGTDLPSLPALRDSCEVVVDYLPASEIPTGVDRIFQNKVELIGLNFAKSRGADWFPFMADTVISSDFFLNVKRRLASGKLVIASSTIRVDLQKYRQAVGGRMDIPVEELYAISMECLHDDDFRYFMLKNPCNAFADPHHVFFRTPEGFSVRTFSWSLYGVNLAALGNFDLCGMTFDSRLICDLLKCLDYNKACHIYTDMPGDAYHINLDDSSGTTRFGELPVTVDQVVKSIRSFRRMPHDAMVFAWNLGHRIKYPIPSHLMGKFPKVEDCLDEESSVSKIVSGVME